MKWGVVCRCFLRVCSLGCDVHLCLCIVCEGSGRSEITGRNYYGFISKLCDTKDIGRRRRSDIQCVHRRKERKGGKQGDVVIHRRKSYLFSAFPSLPLPSVDGCIGYRPLSRLSDWLLDFVIKFKFPHPPPLTHGDTLLRNAHTTRQRSPHA